MVLVDLCGNMSGGPGSMWQVDEVKLSFGLRDFGLFFGFHLATPLERGEDPL